MSSSTLLFHLVATSDLEFDYWSTADLITKFGARLFAHHVYVWAVGLMFITKLFRLRFSRQ